MIDKKKFFLLFVLSILIFSIKWFYSYFISYDLNFFTRILFNIDDRHYLPLMHSLSELDLNPVHNQYSQKKLFLPFPLYSLITHSILFKFFNIFGLLVAELLFIFLFLFLFFKIFELIGIDKTENFSLIILLISLPSLVAFLNLDRLSTYFNSLYHFHSTNFARPLVSIIYLLVFFYLNIRLMKSYSLNLIILISATLSLIFGSVYYHVPICVVTFLIVYIKLFFIKDKKNLQFHLRNFFFSFIGFTLLLPQLPLVINAEPHYTSVVGLTELNLENKKLIILSILSKVMSLKFLSFFLLNTLLFIFIKIKFKRYNNGFEIFYYFFISSIIGYLLFIILSPKISEMYHFNNIIIYSGIISLCVNCFIIFLQLLKNDYLKKKILTLIIVFCFLSLNSFYYNQSIQRNTNEVINVDKVINFLEKNELNKNTKILTFDDNLQIYLILRDYNNILYTNNFFHSKNLSLLENELFFYLKQIGYNTEKFKEIIKNKKTSWRYTNDFLLTFYYLKYQKSLLNIHKYSEASFAKKEWEHFMSTLPSAPQNIYLSKEEEEEFITKFINSNKKFDIPELIIINTNSSITKNVKIDKNYCKNKIGSFIFYILSKNGSCP
jgi:hypothetical protein